MVSVLRSLKTVCRLSQSVSTPTAQSCRCLSVILRYRYNPYYFWVAKFSPIFHASRPQVENHEGFWSNDILFLPMTGATIENKTLWGIATRLHLCAKK